VLRRLQTQVFDHLHELSLGYYAKHESGDLMSRITNDTSTIQQAIGFALIQVLSGALIIVWIAWAMISMNWAYGLISLIVVPAMAVATVWFSNEARKAFRKSRKEIGNVNAELEESISGVREAQAFSREDANIENFRQSNAATRDANVKAVAYTSALAPTLEALGYVAIAIVAGVGGIYMLRGMPLGCQVVTLGMVITFIGFVQRFNGPISQIAVLWANIQSAIAGAERIFDLLDEQPDIVEKFDAKPMPPITGRVVFNHVRAEYNKGEPVPPGCLIDYRGQPTQDPRCMILPPHGALLTFGGHKGYGLAAMCELLGGALASGMTQRVRETDKMRILNGMFSVLVDPDALGQRALFESEALAFIDWVKASPPREDYGPVQMAGDAERAAKAQRSRDGVPVDAATWREILEAGTKLGVPAAQVQSAAGLG
jgi:ABC-type multidrug transport system fused ATPase/permease subunit